MTLWRGRFGAGPADAMWALTESFSFDQRLWPYDLAGSRAHVEGLRGAGLVTDEAAEKIQRALDQVEREFTSGTFAPAASDEDLHTAIERRVREIAGDDGARLHTARSRNDQVATALRLYAKAAAAGTAREVLALVDALVALAAEHPTVPMPGYTHLQRAQPILLAHHLRAHAWALLRDVDRLKDAHRRIDVSPLGAGALAGSSLPIDPARTAAALGFASPFANSLDAVSDRDFVAEFLFDLALVGVHLSRMGEELVLWTTSEFSFAELDDAYATGSSMLPQKKNPDVGELTRGKAGRIIGHLTGLLATLKGLPLAYNRDLQEDKEPLFDAVDQIHVVVGALTGAYQTLRVRGYRMADAAADPGLAATALAEFLVARGTPFREAHERVGRLIARSLHEGLPMPVLVATDELLADAAPLLEPGAALSALTSPGSAGPVAQEAQLAMLDRARSAAGEWCGAVAP